MNPQTNRVHCFVCNKGTDAIGWLQDRQGLTFSEAVQELAGRYGIPIPEEDPEAAARAQAEHNERQRLLAWRDRQQKEFHRALLDDLNQSRRICRPSRSRRALRGSNRSNLMAA